LHSPLALLGVRKRPGSGIQGQPLFSVPDLRLAGDEGKEEPAALQFLAAWLPA